MTSTDTTDTRGRLPGPGRHPVRGRLRRRHAADRRPVHLRDRGVRQRPVHAAELPRRDPRTRRDAAGRVVVPAALRQLRHPHARRPAGRAGRDEPGRAEGQHRRPASRRRPDRQHRRVHQAEPDQGRLRGHPAGRRLAGAVHGAPGRDGDADPRRAGADRAVARRTPSGRRTCSRWVCCRGCTTGPPRAPSGSCGRSSRAARRSPRRTCSRSARATPTARPPSRSP